MDEEGYDSLFEYGACCEACGRHVSEWRIQ
jgi:hypothetical protein